MSMEDSYKKWRAEPDNNYPTCWDAFQAGYKAQESNLAILSLSYNSNVMATLIARDGNILIANASRGCKKRLEKFIRYGISYPESSPLHDLNTDPSQIKTLLNNIGEFYRRLFKIEFTIKYVN